MNTEQLKQLKQGDEIFIRARYKEVTCDGDVLFSHSARNVCDDVVKTYDYTHPKNVILPPSAPKYDPCRRFKKGDKVKRRTVDGRTDQEISEGIDLTVIYGEDKYGNVRVQNPNGICIVTKSVFLELVTPVEELEPYTLEEETAYIDDEECGILHIYYNYNGGRDKVRTFYENGPESWDSIKAAAEAERDRLNAEYRKEHNNE